CLFVVLPAFGIGAVVPICVVIFQLRKTASG
ncbi:hypothetical protein CISIN_1g0434391mg, partial [Citrus sinensis]